MSVSEKKKASNAKWDRENMFTLGCRIRKEQAAAFKDVCAAAGITANTALKDYVMECIDAQALVKPSRGTPANAMQKPAEGADGGGGIHVTGTAENAGDAPQTPVESPSES